MKEHECFYKYESEIAYWHLGKGNVIYSVFQLEHFLTYTLFQAGKDCKWNNYKFYSRNFRILLNSELLKICNNEIH